MYFERNAHKNGHYTHKYSVPSLQGKTMFLDEKVLVVGDSAEELDQIKEILKSDFKKIILTQDEIKAQQLFSDHHPVVIVLAFSSLEKSKKFSTFLLEDEENPIDTPFEVIVFCQAAESKNAFLLCKKEEIDDYVITRPLYDVSRVKLSVIQSVRRGRYKRKMSVLIKEDLLRKEKPVIPEKKSATSNNENEVAVDKSGDANHDLQLKVVIIDDSEVYVVTTEAILMAGGYNVVGVIDSFKAIEVLIKENPDVILLDYNMPGLNGVDVLKSIRAHEKLRSKPVIMLTGDAFPRVVAECFSNGASDFIVKPGDFDTISEKIEKVMAG